MMDSALNRAHQLERKADILLSSSKFEEAIECHERSAELLKVAMQQTTVEMALESLQLQYNYQKNRKRVIKYKQMASEKLREHMEKLAMKEKEEEDLAMSIVTFGQVDEDLQRPFYEVEDQYDSLIRDLWPGGYDVTTGQDLVCASVFPKDDQVVIEELKVSNIELRKCVDLLSTQLVDTLKDKHGLQMENEMLKRRLLDYKTDSFSSNFDNLTSDDLETFYSIPELPPLEMPELDFKIILNKSQSDSNTTF